MPTRVWIVFLVFVFIVGFMTGIFMGMDAFERKAIRAGHAEVIIVDNVNAITRWQWKNCEHCKYEALSGMRP